MKATFLQRVWSTLATLLGGAKRQSLQTVDAAVDTQESIVASAVSPSPTVDVLVAVREEIDAVPAVVAPDLGPDAVGARAQTRTFAFAARLQATAQLNRPSALRSKAAKRNGGRALRRNVSPLGRNKPVTAASRVRSASRRGTDATRAALIRLARKRRATSAKIIRLVPRNRIGTAPSVAAAA